LENLWTPHNTSGKLRTLPVAVSINPVLFHLSFIIFQDFRKLQMLQNTPEELWKALLILILYSSLMVDH
jgi:hypothetical protein